MRFDERTQARGRLDHREVGPPPRHETPEAFRGRKKEDPEARLRRRPEARRSPPASASASNDPAARMAQALHAVSQAEAAAELAGLQARMKQLEHTLADGAPPPPDNAPAQTNPSQLFRGPYHRHVSDMPMAMPET